MSIYFVMFFCFALNAVTQTFNYVNEWKKYDSLKINMKNVDTEFKILEGIIERAIKDNNKKEFLKAIDKIQNNKYYEINKTITLYDRQIKKVKSPEKELFFRLKAKKLIYYSMGNSTRILDKKIIKKDIATWTPEYFKKEISNCYEKSLKNREFAKDVLIKDIPKSLLTIDENKKPTIVSLYDYMVYDAIEYYLSISSHDQANFNMGISEFLELRFKKQTMNDFHRALFLLQELMRYFKKNNDHENFVSTEIFRLNVLKPDNRVLYLGELLETNTENSGYGLAVYALFENFLKNYEKSSDKDQLPESLKIKFLPLCDDVLKKWPDSKGAIICKSIRYFLDSSKYLLVQIEPQLEAKKPFRIFVTYQGINTLYLKAIPITNTPFSKLPSFQDVMNDQPVLSWEFQLPKHDERVPVTTEVFCPGLDYGKYYLVASDSKDFDQNTSFVTRNTCNVSNLSIVTTHFEDKVLITVLDCFSGQPIVNADVFVVEKENSKKNDIIIHKKTDLVGQVFFDNASKIIIEADKDKSGFLLSANNSYSKHFDDDYREYMYVLTDKKIYRPGQTVYYKLLFFKYNDFNRKVIQNEEQRCSIESQDGDFRLRIEGTTNEYGSIAGSFVIPSTLQNGRITFNFDHTIIVEQYKKKGFDIKITPDTKQYNVGENVVINGAVSAYGDFPIDNAKVKYSVFLLNDESVRDYYAKVELDLKKSIFDESFKKTLLKNGQVVSNPDGVFTFSFMAKPEIDENEFYRSNRNFYVVVIEATDVNGETNTIEHIVSAYNSKTSSYISVKLDLPTEVYFPGKRIQLPLSIKDGNGRITNADVTITIKKIRESLPRRVFRKKLWEQPLKGRLYTNTITKAEYTKLFPFDYYEDEKNQHEEEDIENHQIIYKKNVFYRENTKIFIDVPSCLQEGRYVIEINAKIGEETDEVIHEYQIIDEKSKLRGEQFFDFYIKEQNYKPGSIVTLHCWSALESSIVVTTSSKKNIESRVHSIPAGYSTIKIPIGKEVSELFGIEVYGIRLNNRYEKTFNLKVKESGAEYNNLNISFSTFRNKLVPGESEKWTLKIKKTNSDVVDAELATVLYDASLDSIIDNVWTFPRFNSFNRYSFSRQSSRQSYFRDKPEVSDIISGFSRDYYVYPEVKDTDMFRYSMVQLMKNIDRMILPGDTTGKIFGRVLEESTGEPIPGATVMIEGTQLGASTMANGEYFVLGVEPGVYKVKCLVVGYSTASIQSVYVGTNNRTYVEFHMATKIAGMEHVIIDSQNRPIDGFEKPITEGKIIHGKTFLALQSELYEIALRKKFSDTAFFYPQLRPNSKKEIEIDFTIPEMITRWRFQGFTHDKNMHFGLVQRTLVTQKELMVIPNPPRFLREGDTIDFTAKVTNLTENVLKGRVELLLLDAESMQPIHEKFSLANAQQSFTAQKGKSDLITWRLKIPVGISAVTYRVVAKSGKFSDGEEMMLPILTNKQLVAESKSVPIGAYSDTHIELPNLLNTASDSLVHHALTFELSSNVTWYAVESLPYLIDYPYGCLEQTFSQYYANKMALHVLKSSPTVKSYFESMKNNPDSLLFKKIHTNTSLYTLMQEEMPWILNGRSQRDYRHRVSVMFQDNELAREMEKAFEKFEKSQNPNGSLSWFPGGPEDRFITQHIVSGFGHLIQLGIVSLKEEARVQSFVTKAVRYLDSAMFSSIQSQKTNGHNQHVSSEIHYFYMRSFFSDIPLEPRYKDAYTTRLNALVPVAQKESVMLRTMLALALHRNGNSNDARAFLKALLAESECHESTGRKWVNGGNYYWYDAPIETHALLIEAFSEIEKNVVVVDEIKTWLIVQRKDRYWHSTKGTVEACYALLLGGIREQKKDKPLQVVIGDRQMNTSALTDNGFLSTSFHTQDITSAMGRVSVKNPTDQMAWGTLTWQYFESLDKIPQSSSALSVRKELFVERMNGATVTWEPVTAQTHLQPGDKVRATLHITAAKQMQYVHLKDMRASCFEPMNVVSEYKSSGNLGYYMTTKDASTNFFMYWLPEGTHTIEYMMYVTHTGNFSNGITTIQCMYAPEFTSHSEGIRVNITGK